ncbi:putative T7SS-secreted protein [Streptomyces sp. NPDC046939]|uniref:putative T7SS-secreted protein n=1 Tax=Streptomyces sp. NPDC046939 TaxID=3155376 RepID=UPI0033CBEAFD
MTTQTYDALGFDPAPGVPASVQKLVTSLEAAGKRLSEAHGTLSKLGKANAAWEGLAAEAFTKKLGSLPKYLADGHSSVADASHALNTWHTRLTEFQILAARYEREAEAARRTLTSAQGSPDLKLAGKTFDTDAALHDAQRRLDHAVQRVNEAQGDLDAIIRKARSLLEHHDEAARAAASIIRKAADLAPDQSLLDKFMDTLKGIGDQLKKMAGDLWKWIQKHADTIYKIGDWLGYASAACDVLAVVFSETIIGAAVFEGIGMALNGGALAMHGLGWAAGAKKGSWVDIGLDVVGFVPFGDFLRVGKVATGAFKGVKIPMEVADFGAKAADSWKRADDIIQHVGGSARLGSDAEKWFMRNARALGGKADAIHITADTFADRFKVAVARELGDRNLYRAGTGITDAALHQVVPKLVEHTPLGRIPAIADSVKPFVDDAGRISHYVDPHSWTARGYEAATGAHNLYKEGVRHFSEDIQYGSEKVHESLDRARDTAGNLLNRASALNPF